MKGGIVYNRQIVGQADKRRITCDLCLEIVLFQADLNTIEEWISIKYGDIND